MFDNTPGFLQNMLSESVLKIDVCQYLEENWPLDDSDLEKNSQTVQISCVSSMFSLGFPDLGERETQTFSFLRVCQN